MQAHNQKMLDLIRSKGGLELRWQDGLKGTRAIKIEQVCEFQDARGKVHLCPVFPGLNFILHPIAEVGGEIYYLTSPIGGSLDMRPRGDFVRSFEDARDQYNKECEMSGSPTRVLDIYEI